jgi:hypothetical protein
MLPRKPISKPAILRSVCGVIGCASKVSLRLWSGQELTHRWDDVGLAPLCDAHLATCFLFSLKMHLL